jgi:hypothetical protein
LQDSQEDRIIDAIDDLAAYALAHGMIVLHRALAAVSALIKGFAESKGTASVPSADWFDEVLDLLISNARRNGWAEVLDHLLEAKQAWDERDKNGPNGNILVFKKKSRE